MKKNKKQFGRKLALSMSLFMMVTMLGACNSKTATTKDATTTTKEELKEVTLKIFTAGDDKAGKADVLAALAAQTKDKLNAKFEINFVAFGDYQNKLTMMAASGDDYDAAFTADWFGYSNMVNKGAFLDLTELAPKYAPNLYKIYKDNDMLNSASVNGKLLALPWTELKTSKPVFGYRKDISDKLAITPGDLTTIEGIDTFVTAVAKANPGVTPFDLNIGGAGLKGDIVALLAPKYEYLDMSYHSLFMDLNDATHKVVPLEQTPMFKEAVTLAKKWYDSGVISKNAMSSKESQPFESGKTFGQKNTAGRLYEKTNFTDPKAAAAAVEVYPDNKFIRDSQMNNAMAINKSAANPERMLMFMDLISTDKAVYNTLMYGIKDKTYSLDASGIVGFATGESAAKPLWQGWNNWGFDRADFVLPTVSRTADAMKKETEYATRENIVISPISGFVPVSDAVKTDLAQRDQIADEQGKLLLSGMVKGSVDADIATYVAKQKSAGLDKILADVQKQVDAFTSK